MFNLNDITRNELAQGLPVGIHSACTFDKIQMEADHILCTFSDSNGRKISNRINWEPMFWERDGETKEDAQQRATRQSLSHVVKLLHIYFPLEQIKDFSAPDAKTFCLKAVTMLAPVIESKKVNLKLIYNSKGTYPSFGNYPNYIEEYVEGQEVTLKYSTWELANRVEKPQPKIDETPLNNANTLL